MNEPNSNQILKSITRFRKLAIGSAAFVAILAAMMVISVISVLDATTATKISITGKKRLLAQQILTDAITIDHAIQTQRWDELEPILKDLRKSTQDIQEAHAFLSDFVHRGGATQEHTMAEQEVLANIALPYQTMVKSAVELNKLTISIIRRSPYIDQLTLDRVTASKDEIVESHAALLPGIEKIVLLEERKYESEIDQSVAYAKFGMILLLLVLAANILFIIEPTFLIIRRQLHELDKATKQVARSDAVRWRLLSNMGHEFRTPMNAIVGFTDLLAEKTLSNSERTRLIKSICDSSTQLTHLIETMLDMSAIESGQLRIINEPCNLHQTLEKLYKNAVPQAKAKQLDLTLHIDESCPIQIETDTKRLEQIIYNLIDNAIKFTDIGQINISATIVNTPNLQTLEIKVADTGVGIKPEDQQSIFELFTQSDDNLTRSFGGAGLGLTVSRELARALNGDVAVESILGEGSTFTLTIGLKETLHQGTPLNITANTQPTQASLESIKLLIVDDAKDNRVLLEHILKKTGAMIEQAHDGQQAIDAIKAAIKNQVPFDLILMDMQMPVLDGYHATVELREQGISTPIIALTAHALDGDREHCLAAGCDEYMAKPINKNALIETCIQLIARTSASNTHFKHAA